MNDLRTLFATFLTVLLTAAGVLAEETQLPGERFENGRVLRVNEMDMYYEIRGEGPPLVLLHGFFGTGDWEWEPYIPVFAKKYQLILPDLRGHGRSNNPSGEFTHRQAALDVFALLDAMGISQFQGMGVSSGGMTLLHMATQQPERVEAMILAGATHYYPQEARSFHAAITIDGLPGLDGELWQSVRKVHGDDKLRALVDQFHRLKDNYDDMNFTPPFLSTIKARTFIVHGDRDEHFPVPIPVEMYRCIPHSYLWIVPNSGHVPFFEFPTNPRLDDEKTLFTKKVLEFLRGDWEKKSQPR